MRDISCSMRTCLGIGLLITLEAIFTTTSSRALCYSTPRAAVDASHHYSVVLSRLRE